VTRCASATSARPWELGNLCEHLAHGLVLRLERDVGLGHHANEPTLIVHDRQAPHLMLCYQLSLPYSMTPKPKVTSPGSAMCTDTIASRRIHRPSSTSIHSPEYGTCPLVKLSSSSCSVPSSTVFAKSSSGRIVNVRVATVSEHTPGRSRAGV
jgi:hypothetical protein